MTTTNAINQIDSTYNGNSQQDAAVEIVQKLMNELKGLLPFPEYTNPPSAAWVKASEQLTSIEGQIKAQFSVMGFQQDASKECRIHGWNTHTFPYYGTVIDHILGSALDFVNGHTPPQNYGGAADYMFELLTSLNTEMTSKPQG